MKMNDQEIFQEIARGLKTFHNAALELIKAGELNQAQKMLENAGHLSSITGYREGIAMSMFSLANLALLQEELVRALQAAAQSLEYFSAEEDLLKATQLAEKIALQLVKQGIDKEAGGEKGAALELFTLALPYLKGKRRQAVDYEINLLRKQVESG